jgi:hypothetical protein
MNDLVLRVFYHLWSSSLAGSLALASISLTASRSSRADRDGFTNWIYSRRFALALVFSVWTHIGADVIEHGSAPKICEGIRGVITALGGSV